MEEEGREGGKQGSGKGEMHGAGKRLINVVYKL